MNGDRRTLQSLQHMFGASGAQRPSVMNNNRRRSEYVRFHPDDDQHYYPDALFEHPNNFVPNKDWAGRTIWWGLSPIVPQGKPGAGHVDHDYEHLMMRKMAGNLYGRAGGNAAFPETPEEQFVGALVDKQIRKLEAMDLGDLVHRDYTLKIVMEEIKDNHGNDMIWREFRVSGGISIAALADKVITPLMGWVRNYHAHAFTVHKDGAVYGPTVCFNDTTSQVQLMNRIQESKAIDMMHLQSIGYGAVPEKSNRGVWTLAHLLQEEGETMLWVYDYGDNYTHVITVEEIAPVSESTGKVAVLDGAGACPREDGSGNHEWAEEVRKLASPIASERETVLGELRRALNYKGRTIGASFDPEDFDLAEARARVHAALGSPDSVGSGAKTFVSLLHEGAVDDFHNGSGAAGRLRRGQTLERTWDDEEGGPRVGGRYMEEITSSKRDKKDGACCYMCGTPHNLSGCTGCRKAFYCGTECQKAHWNAGHRAQCKKWRK
ncbi:hypothetical protein FA95DRAFT_301524 [Auriscalpium vulgare]|uniref:Uncharacterized protein n=1 Tax=Auriscalpium vulgare TaxID=40419 RepID=A0ACB8RKK7_9AGAM|nr:hypothetical protein FA95DRAFT_301524 [Auriscalpium vulgare]